MIKRLKLSDEALEYIIAANAGDPLVKEHEFIHRDVVLKAMRRLVHPDIPDSSMKGYLERNLDRELEAQDD